KTTGRSIVGNIYLPTTVVIQHGDVVSFSGNPSVISVRRSFANSNVKLAHYVNWDDTGRKITIALKRSLFPSPPTQLYRSSGAKLGVITVAPLVLGDHYVYRDIVVSLGGWVILAP